MRAYYALAAIALMTIREFPSSLYYKLPTLRDFFAQSLFQFDPSREEIRRAIRLVPKRRADKIFVSNRP